eukprot:1160951-Pelagomonas_calceolata.AAC.3
MARLVEERYGLYSHYLVDCPTHTQKDCVERVNMAVSDVQFIKLPGWSCASLYLFVASHTAET